MSKNKKLKEITIESFTKYQPKAATLAIQIVRGNVRRLAAFTELGIDSSCIGCWVVSCGRYRSGWRVLRNEEFLNQFEERDLDTFRILPPATEAQSKIGWIYDFYTLELIKERTGVKITLGDLEAILIHASPFIKSEVSKFNIEPALKEAFRNGYRSGANPTLASSVGFEDDEIEAAWLAYKAGDGNE